MLDHVGLNVRDLPAAKAFYAGALEPLGYGLVVDADDHAGFRSSQGAYDFWLHDRGETSAPVHVAFRAPERRVVDAFHRAALAAGGTDNGAPGLRPEYHARYYGAFVLDPDGNNVEAVCHG